MMNVTRALDPVTNDISFPNGTIATIDSVDATVQAVKTRLAFFQGEWFLDITAGIPWLQKILKKNVNPQEIASLIKTEILKTDGITGLTAFDLDFEPFPRTLNVSFQATTTQGDTGTVPFTLILQAG